MGYRNAAVAFVSELREIRRSGATVTVRGNETRELLARTVQLDRPTERCITVPARRNDIAAAIAETMWVIAGRNDLGFLSQYLPRAVDYSDDDGKTWRAGYGPRLRNWNGVDQVAEVLSLLREDPESRRAVVGLYDPAQDFIPRSNDIPCNNWLHFLIRGGRLYLDIAVRSNDVWWGFSGINTFEWSVLHEMMAFWLGVDVGRETFFISSLHLYQRHYERAAKVIDAYLGTNGYDKGWAPVRFATPWDQFPVVLEQWFEIESAIARGVDSSTKIDAFPDPLLRQFLRMIELGWAEKKAADRATLESLVNELGTSDLAFAASEHLFRNSSSLPNLLPPRDDFAELRDAVTALHRSKDESYRNAWKKRGERISIASNLARKVDRIEAIADGASPNDESLLDTAIDLFVYCLKYQTYLADQDPAIADTLFGQLNAPPFSDGPAGFDSLIVQQSFVLSAPMTINDAAQNVVADFNSLDLFLQTANDSDWSSRMPFILRLTAAALQFLLVDARVEPDVVDEMVDRWKVTG